MAVADFPWLLLTPGEFEITLMECSHDMNHVGVAYTVRVRVLRQKEEYRLLGNFDNSGHYLLDGLAEFFAPGFKAESDNRLRTATCVSTTANEPELQVIATHGLTGVGYPVLREDGTQDRINPPDTSYVTCGLLFQLPRDQSIGFLAVHVNDNRRVKTLLTEPLKEHFQQIHPNLRLEINPCVNRGILESAVSRDEVRKMHLVRYERPSDRANSDTNKWVAGGRSVSIEVTISPRGQHARIQTGLLQRWLNHDASAFQEIIAFAGLDDADEAKAEVVLPDGRTKIVNLSNPAGGAATRFDLTGVEEADNGDPIVATIFTDLRTLLADVQGDYLP